MHFALANLERWQPIPSSGDDVDGGDRRGWRRLRGKIANEACEGFIAALDVDVDAVGAVADPAAEGVRVRQAEDVRSPKRRSGVGLGLAIVRHLAELHGGHVLVDSAGPGQGATFVVVLPAVESAALVSA